MLTSCIPEFSSTHLPSMSLAVTKAQACDNHLKCNSLKHVLLFSTSKQRRYVCKYCCTVELCTTTPESRVLSQTEALIRLFNPMSSSFKKYSFWPERNHSCHRHLLLTWRTEEAEFFIFLSFVSVWFLVHKLLHNTIEERFFCNFRTFVDQLNFYSLNNTHSDINLDHNLWTVTPHLPHGLATNITLIFRVFSN